MKTSIQKDTIKDFKEEVINKFVAYKEGNLPLVISSGVPFPLELRPLVSTSVHDRTVIKRLSRWRRKAQTMFPSIFPVSNVRTKYWMKEQLFDKEDRILFFIFKKGMPIPFGHIGLYRFEWNTKSCQIDNVIRGSESVQTKGGMKGALEALCHWAFVTFSLDSLTLHVFEDNIKAVNLYMSCGFVIEKKIPQQKKQVNDREIEWVDNHTVSPEKAERMLLMMRRQRST